MNSCIASLTRVKTRNDREKAFDETIKLAWYYFYDRRDSSTAMKRFNQAWLIDSNNNEVFYGFGFLMAADGKVNEAIPLYKKALELKPTDSMAAARLGACYKDKAYEQFLRSKSAKDPAVKAILAKSLVLFDQIGKRANFQSGLRETSLNDDLAYIFYQWAVVLEFDGQYTKSWKKVTPRAQFWRGRSFRKGLC
jgi:tetratricopeptide (TPR) repeat protein